MSQPLAGKNVLITGASRGIGAGCAVQCAKAGANVAINYRSQHEAAEAVAQQVQQAGGEAICLQADVADQSAVEDLVSQTAERFGQVDAFISNAVYSDRHRMIDADMDGFRRTIDVSMWGAFYGVRAVAQHLVEQHRPGAIVVISSPHAKIPVPTAMAYNMAKAAIDHMARTAAIELAEHRIRVNVVHPGWIDTPGERKFFSEQQLREGAGNIPWGRLGSPEEIGRLACLMLTDDFDYMTGSTVLMDGGISLPWWSNREAGQQ